MTMPSTSKRLEATADHGFQLTLHNVAEMQFGVTGMSETVGWGEQKLKASAQSCLNGMESIREKARIDQKKHFYQSYQDQHRLKLLQMRPALARVVLVSERTDNQIEIMVCSGVPPVGKSDEYPHNPMPTRIHELSGSMAASYHSAMGRFVSCQVGDVVDDFYIQEIEKLYPELKEEILDSINTEFRSPTEVLTVTSLRRLVSKSDSEAQQSDEAWLMGDDADDEQDSIIMKGVVRRQKKDFGLDAIIVNKEQDRIFRAPIDSRFVLLGAPGTGKTTTLVHRLSKWVSVAAAIKGGNGEGVVDLETERVIRDAFARGMNDDWVLFVPTELLKTYVRNALDNQGMGKLHRDIQTWDDFSYELGHIHFGLYTRGSRSGGFVRQQSATWLLPRTLRNQAAWFEAFEQHRGRHILEQIRGFARLLSQSDEATIRELGERISQIAERKTATVISVMGDLLVFEQDLHDIAQDTQKKNREKVLGLARVCNARIDNLQAIWTEHCKAEKLTKREPEDEAEESEEDVDLDEGSAKPGDVLLTTLRAYVTSVARNRVAKKGRMADRYALLQKGLPDRETAEELGRKILEARAASRLNRVFNSWVGSISQQYRAFRKKNLDAEEGGWYSKDGYTSNALCQAELDLLILARLEAYKAAKENKLIYRRYQEEIDQFHNCYCKMMVFVDEVTDFSPLQLASMYLLAHPEVRSFFACGDINQRMTDEGLCSIEDIKWAVPVADDSIINLRTVYRQTKVLHYLGQMLLRLNKSAVEDRSTSNEEVEYEGIQPAFCEYCESAEREAHWIAERIAEVFNLCNGDLPTIAIFVPEKKIVEEFADLLEQSPAIQRNSLRVKACPDGAAIAPDIQIGVYPVDKIKGLEFEAVFFSDVDVLHDSHPGQFAQYLYVGATRAVQFFGMTSKEGFPLVLSDIRELFGQDWNQHQSGDFDG